MVIRENVNSNLVTHEQAASLHPFLQIFSPIDDRFVPQLGELLYGMTVAKPANVGEIGGDEFGPVAVLRVLRHPRMIDQGQCDIVFAQKVKNGGPSQNLFLISSANRGLCGNFSRNGFNRKRNSAPVRKSSY